jgi:hypothetical protein
MNNQVRGFAIVWTGITIAIGVATFFALYLTYSGNTTDPLNDNRISLPAAEDDVPQQAALVTTHTPQPSPTARPTSTLQALGASAESTEAAAAEATEPTGNAGEAEQGLAVAQVVPTMEPTALPVNEEGFQLGIQVQTVIDGNREVQRAWMNDVGQLGLNWIKVQVRWDEIEIEPGQYEWGRMDLAFDTAADYGYKVLASVVTAPDWAREEGADLTLEGPPSDPQIYADFLAALLGRYFGKVHAIEVWNEQNLDREWASVEGLSAANYVDLLRVSFLTIKELDPGIIVISGALSPGGGFVDEAGVTRAVDDFSFMEGLLDAGMLNYADCVGAHHNGYNIGPSVPWDEVEDDPDALFRGPFDNPHHSWSLYSTLQGYASYVQLAGSDTRICVTEFGWATVEDIGDGTVAPPGFEFALDNTLEEQGEWMLEAIENFEQWDFMWIAIIWNLNYGPQAGWSVESDNTPYSLIGPEFSRRPAYVAVQDWSAARREEAGE